MKNNKLALISSDFKVKSATNYLIRLYSFWFLLGLICGTGLLYSFKEDPQTKNIKIIYLVGKGYESITDIKLNKKEILDELIKNKCILPNVAFAQFSQESLHFKSDICKENKNIAGIRNSSSKYVIGMNRGHCVYASYRDCIKDYIRIQNLYLKNINKKYAEDSNYINKLKNIKVHIK
jgi:hypothetical protein